MRRLMVLVTLVGCVSVVLILNTAPLLGAEWQAYRDVGAAGWSAERLEEAKRVAEATKSASVMVVHHGTVVAAWGQVDRPFPIYSMRKGLYNALLGIAVAEGKIALDHTLAQLGVDDIGMLTDSEKSATVHDLLTARSGVYHPAAYEPGSMRRTRPERGSHAPGEFWFYNNWDFNVVASLVAGAGGQGLSVMFRDRIATPLGMEDFSLDDTFSFLEPSRSRYPAVIFKVSARDLARFGLLYLRKGDWNGTRILESEWVDETLTPRATFPAGSPFGAGNCFGYLWWIYPKREDAEWELQRRTEIVLTRGAEGQVLAVVPSMDLVVVNQSDTENDDDARFEDVARLIFAIANALENAESDPRAAETVTMHAEPLPNPKPGPPHRVAIPWTPKLIAQLVGDYQLNPTVSFHVHAVDGRLFALPEGAPLAEVELFAETPSLVFSPAVDLLLEVKRGPSGRAETLVGRVNHRPAELARVEK